MYTNRGFLRRDKNSKWTQNIFNPYPRTTQLSVPTYPKIYEGKNKSLSPSKPISINEEADLLDHIGHRSKFNGSFNPSPHPQPKFEIAPTAGYETAWRQYQSPKVLKAPPLNLHKTNSIFEIQSDKGYGGFRRFAGMGFLITPSLAFTTNMVIPNATQAMKSSAHFLDSYNIPHGFDPNEFFFTHEELNFTIIAFRKAPNSDYKLPLPLHEFFSLKVDDPVVLYHKKVDCKNATLIDDETFCYTSGTDIPQGLPIFDYSWELQGIHNTSTFGTKINQATRVDAIFRFLLSIRHMIKHQELDMMLESQPYEVIQQAPKKPVIEQNIYLFWFEWFTRNIFRYNSTLELWNRLEPSNLRELDASGNWYFLWNSRMAYTPTGNCVILGGVSDRKGTINNDAYLYKPTDNTLHKLPGMLEARESPAIVCLEQYVFALGGRAGLSTCERFSFDTYEWVSIAPMVQGRYSHCACALQGDRFIYAIGGCPIEVVGKSIERYLIEENAWELVALALPEPLTLFGALPVSQNKIALLGGKYTKRVFVLEVNEMYIDTHYNPRYLMPESDIFRLHEIPSFTTSVETVFPVVIDEGSDKVLIMSGNDGYAHLQLVTYPYKHFLTLSNPVQPQLQKSMLSRSYPEIPQMRNPGLLPPIHSKGYLVSPHQFSSSRMYL